MSSVLGNTSSDSSGVNPFLQQKLNEVVATTNQEIQRQDLFLNNSFDKEKDSELAGFELLLPSYVCRDSSYDSMASLSFWYENQESSIRSSSFENELNEIASKTFDGFERFGQPLDALAWGRLEVAQSSMIEPNIERAKKLLNEDLRQNKPGTEVEFDNIRLITKPTQDGREQAFAYVDMRLRLTKTSSLIKFDSGAEFLTLEIPMRVSIFDETMRPEKKGDVQTNNAKIEIYPEYPIRIMDPNTGNIVDHLLKKYIAYPRLAEAIVHKPDSNERRSYSIPLPKNLGLPVSGQAIGFDLSNPFFKTMSDGQGVMFVPIRYRFKQEAGENLPSQTITVKP